MNFQCDFDEVLQYENLCKLIEEKLENNSLDLSRLDMFDIDLDVRDTLFTNQDTEFLFQKLMETRSETRHAINCRQNNFYFSQLSSKVIGRNKTLDTRWDSKWLSTLVIKEMILSKILSQLHDKPSENTLSKSKCAICCNELSAEDRECPVCKETISGNGDPHKDNKPLIKEVFEEKSANLCTYCDGEIISGEDECEVCGGPPVGPDENDAHATMNHEYITPYENSVKPISMGKSSDYRNIEIMPISCHRPNNDMKVTEKYEEHYKVEPSLIESRDCVPADQKSKDCMNIDSENKLDSSSEIFQNSNKFNRTKGEHEAGPFHDDSRSWNGAGAYACAGIKSLDNQEGTFERMGTTVNHNPCDISVRPMNKEKGGTDSKVWKACFNDLEETSRKTFVIASPINEVDCGLGDFTGKDNLEDAEVAVESPKTPLNHSSCDMRCEIGSVNGSAREVRPASNLEDYGKSVTVASIPFLSKKSKQENVTTENVRVDIGDVDEGRLVHDGKDCVHLQWGTMYCPSFPNMTDQGHSNDQKANEDRADINKSSPSFSSKSPEIILRRVIVDSPDDRDCNEDGPKNDGVTILDPLGGIPLASQVSLKRVKINSIQKSEYSYLDGRGYSLSDSNEDPDNCLWSPQCNLHNSEDLKESFKPLNDKSIIQSSKWSCAQCGFLNSAPENQCKVCEKCPSFVEKLPCKMCTFNNDRFATNCVACGAVNEDLEICKSCESFMINKSFSEVCEKCFAGNVTTKDKEVYVECKESISLVMQEYYDL